MIALLLVCKAFDKMRMREVRTHLKSPVVFFY